MAAGQIDPKALAAHNDYIEAGVTKAEYTFDTTHCRPPRLVGAASALEWREESGKKDRFTFIRYGVGGI